jgi:hypothetical protein
VLRGVVRRGLVIILACVQLEEPMCKHRHLRALIQSIKNLNRSGKKSNT